MNVSAPDSTIPNCPRSVNRGVVVGTWTDHTTRSRGLSPSFLYVSTQGGRVQPDRNDIIRRRDHPVRCDRNHTPVVLTLSGRRLANDYRSANASAESRSQLTACSSHQADTSSTSRQPVTATPPRSPVESPPYTSARPGTGSSGARSPSRSRKRCSRARYSLCTVAPDLHSTAVSRSPSSMRISTSSNPAAAR